MDKALQDWPPVSQLELARRLSCHRGRISVGEFDGIERGQDEFILFMYGPDADALFRAVEPVLRTYPLRQNARVVIRSGGPDAVGRELRLGADPRMERTWPKA